jgi:hypothetical protein
VDRDDTFFKCNKFRRGQDVQKDLHPRTGRYKTMGKTHEMMERGSRNRSSSAGSEKMERDGDR